MATITVWTKFHGNPPKARLTETANPKATTGKEEMQETSQKSDLRENVPYETWPVQKSVKETDKEWMKRKEDK